MVSSSEIMQKILVNAIVEIFCNIIIANVMFLFCLELCIGYVIFGIKAYFVARFGAVWSLVVA
ncbi:MAG: hypothetical protein RR635_06345, partial [Oscillospiraceae bacterium]